MSDHNLLTLKLNLREKIAYGMGDVSSNLMFSIGTLYPLKFYIDELGMPVYYGRIIFPMAKFLIAFTDMPIGFLFGLRKDIGPKGKFRLLILYAAILAVLVATLQSIATTFSLPVKTTIATALFMMFGLSYSLMNCSYGAVIPAITKNPNKRAQLTVYRQGGATIGLLTCTVALTPLQPLSSDSTAGYTYAALMFSISGFIFTMLCYRGARKYYMDMMPTGHKANILKSFCTISHNPSLPVLCIASLCTLATFNIKLAIQVYYAQYVLNDINLLSWMEFFNMECIPVGVLLVPLTIKCFGKKQVYLANVMLWVVRDILNYCWGSSSFTFVMFSRVASFGTAFVNSLNWTLVLGTIDYGGQKTDIHAEDSAHTGYTFFHKISAAPAGFLSGIMLTQIGYIPNITQSDATSRGLRQLIFIWSYALVTIAALTMGFFCTLNGERFVLIIEEADQRKNKEIGTEEEMASVTL